MYDANLRLDRSRHAAPGLDVLDGDAKTIRLLAAKRVRAAMRAWARLDRLLFVVGKGVGDLPLLTATHARDGEVNHMTPAASWIVCEGLVDCMQPGTGSNR